MPELTLLQKYDRIWAMLMQLDEAPRHCWCNTEWEYLRHEIRAELAAAPPAQVHIVIEGYYSDKQLVAVWSTKEAAQKQLDMSGDEFHMESFELDTLTGRLTKGLSEWSIRMQRNGDLLYSTNHGICDDAYYPTRAHIHAPHWRANEQQYIHCSCWARSKEHAVKITNDIRAQIIAQDNWTHKYQWRG